jgi:hypothetical protein
LSRTAAHHGRGRGHELANTLVCSLDLNEELDVVLQYSRALYVHCNGHAVDALLLRIVVRLLVLCEEDGGGETGTPSQRLFARAHEGMRKDHCRSPLNPQPAPPSPSSSGASSAADAPPPEGLRKKEKRLEDLLAKQQDERSC